MNINQVTIIPSQTEQLSQLVSDFNKLLIESAAVFYDGYQGALRPDDGLFTLETNGFLMIETEGQLWGFRPGVDSYHFVPASGGYVYLHFNVGMQRGGLTLALLQASS